MCKTMPHGHAAHDSDVPSSGEHLRKNAYENTRAEGRAEAVPESWPRPMAVNERETTAAALDKGGGRLLHDAG